MFKDVQKNVSFLHRWPGHSAMFESFVFVFPSVVTSKHLFRPKILSVILSLLVWVQTLPLSGLSLVVFLRMMPAQIWSSRPLRTTNFTRWREICKKKFPSPSQTLLWLYLLTFHVLTSCPLVSVYICSQKTPGWEVHHDCSQAHRSDHRGLVCCRIWLVSSRCCFLSAHLNTRGYSTFSCVEVFVTQLKCI